MLVFLVPINENVLNSNRFLKFAKTRIKCLNSNDRLQRKHIISYKF